MKNLQLIIAVLLLMSNISKSQTTFLKHYPSPEYDSFFSVAETENSGYIICGSKQIDGANSIFNSWVAKMDLQGVLINDTLLSSNDVASTFSFIRKSKFDNSKFYISGHLDPSDTMNFTGIWEYNQDLSLIQVFGTEFNDTLLNAPVGYINLGDSAFFLFSGTRHSTSSSPDISLLKISPTDNSYTLFEPDEYRLRWPSGILFDSLQENIQIAYIGADIKSGSPVKVLSFDLSLNNTATYEPNLNFTNLNYGFNFINDSSLILTGYRDGFSLDNNCMLAYKFDNNMNVLDSLQVYSNADTITYPGWGQSVLSMDTCIWVVAIHNLDPNTLWQSTPTWIQLSRINSDFELTDQFYYGGDGSYNPFDIIQTSDGGIMVTGNYFNPKAIPLVFQRDPFVLKVNSEGLIVNVDNPEKPIAQEAIVLPNPGNEFLQVKLAVQHKSADFQLFDINGRLILEEHLQADMQRIATGTLKRGTYIYRITASNRVIGSGKWVKE